MTLIKRKMIFQIIYQSQCGQVLNNLKMACTHPCSQGSYRVKGLRLNFPVSAHNLSLEFESFYRIWIFLKGEKYLSDSDHSPSSILDSRQWSESER